MPNNPKILERLGNCVGPLAAMKICSRWAGRPLYIPLHVPGRTIPNDHPIAALIGRRLAQDLVLEFGGETISVPGHEFRDLRRAGLVEALRGHNVPNRLIALALGISENRVRQLVAEMEAQPGCEAAGA